MQNFAIRTPLLWGGLLVLLCSHCDAEQPDTREFTGTDSTSAETRASVNQTTSDSDSNAKKTRLNDPCQDQVKLAASNDSHLEWIATKNETKPVIGSHSVAGELSLGNWDKIKSVSLELEFAEDDMDSGNQLRDQRILDYVFLWQDESPITFQVDDWTPDNSVALPDIGESVALDVPGTVMIAGRKTSINLPLLVTRTHAGLTVMNSQPVRFDMVQDFGLGQELQSLMSLVEATLEDQLEFRFQAEFELTCIP